MVGLIIVRMTYQEIIDSKGHRAFHGEPYYTIVTEFHDSNYEKTVQDIEKSEMMTYCGSIKKIPNETFFDGLNLVQKLLDRLNKSEITLDDKIEQISIEDELTKIYK